MEPGSKIGSSLNFTMLNDWVGMDIGSIVNEATFEYMKGNDIKLSNVDYPKSVIEAEDNKTNQLLEKFMCK